MTVRTPEPERSGRLAASVPDALATEPAPSSGPVGSAANGAPAKPARRGGRYAGMSDEEREEIESAIAQLWREYKDTKVSFGLIDAIEKFDLERAIKFETYAISRIKGAIIDELRSIDWIPRSVRYKAREVEKAYAALEAKLRRSPTEAEVAAELGIALEDLHTIFSQVSFVNVVALDELLTAGGEKGDKLSLVDTLEDTKAEDPVQAFESEETKHLLAKAINTLPEREKIVVTLYYYEGLTLAEIGQVLGVTESRICQMHTKAVLQLRGKLSDTDD